MSSSLVRVLLHRAAAASVTLAPHQTLHKTSALSRCGALRYRQIRGINTFTLPLRTEEKVTVNFVNRDGKRISVTALTGNSILDVVVDQNLDFDGFGACEGTLACSTCHVILEEDVYKKLGSISDEEMDMLDLAYGLTDTSRLGCQVCLRKDLEGMILRVPETVADARVDSQQESST
ncbi:adrenodoxin [Triplophysa dalaica]|uniref:adrenodoxin n=1 Tax=Triplophysa dalaica TaxID=1582913 RepID=UPI0024DFA1E4|nr:adrenodoxin [Triplophysa dalaica]